jgi:hypothetical protein
MSQHVSAATYLRQLQIIQNLALNRLLNVILCQVNNVILGYSRRNLTATHLLKVILILIGNNLTTCEALDRNDHVCIN